MPHDHRAFRPRLGPGRFGPPARGLFRAGLEVHVVGHVAGVGSAEGAVRSAEAVARRAVRLRARRGGPHGI